VKAVLLDQGFVAGIGNIYSDEMLFDAGLRYDRSTDSLSTSTGFRLRPRRSFRNTLWRIVKSHAFRFVPCSKRAANRNARR